MDQETEQNAEAEALAFSAGYTDATEIQPQAEEAPQEAPEVIETAPVVEPPSFTLDDLKTMVDNLQGDVQKKHDTALGRYGELNRTLQNMQQQQPGKMVLTAANLKRMSAEFPDLAEMLAEDLNGALPSGAAFDPNLIDERIQPLAQQFKADLEASEQKHERKLLRAYHKDWEQVATSVPYAAWKATLPAEEQKQMDESWDAEFAAQQIDKFKAHQASVKTNSQKTPVSKKRLEAALTPQGTVNTGAPALTEADHFRAGFAS